MTSDGVDTEDGFPINDLVGAWVPHGRFVIVGAGNGDLAGLRFAAKDLFDVTGQPTGAGNPAWLASHQPAAASSPVVEQLLAAGATLTGKVITDELAYSLHGDNIHYGAPLNASAPDRVTGGSSSGSAAAAAARLVDFALGTDTGGSTRVPASYCGVWGLRTTHGVLSTEGLVGLHPSYDTVTWLAADSEVFLRVGQVLLPSASCRFSRLLRLDDACALADPAFEAPLRAVERAVADVLGVGVQAATAAGGDALSVWRQAYATSGAYEGWQLHGRWILAQHPRFAAPIQARWDAAREVSEQAAGAARVRVAEFRTAIRSLLRDDAVALLPSAASIAPKRDAPAAEVDAVRMRTMEITCIAGVGGLPQVSIPLRGAAGLPVGVSLLGPAGSDLELIRLARQVAERLAPEWLWYGEQQ